MKKITKTHFIRLAFIAILSLTAIETYAKFWGVEKDPMGGISGSPDGSQCFQTYTVKHYIFWIEVSSSVETEQVPCPAGQGRD